MSEDRDQEIAAAIKATTDELTAARDVVHDLANELADVIDVIEPALAEHTKRLRAARMGAIDEMRLITTQIREMRELILGEKTEQMLIRGERFVKLMRDVEEFRACGFLDDFVRLLAGRDA
jgi:hypothetical protein